MLITTTFLPQTSTKPDRIKATYEHSELVYDANSELSSVAGDNFTLALRKHVAVAVKLSKMLNLKEALWHIHPTEKGFLS